MMQLQNSWNRMPFLHDLHPGGKPSFTPLPTEVVGNFIISNFGGSQGVDNDDGSSGFSTHGNVFYMSDGFVNVWLEFRPCCCFCVFLRRRRRRRRRLR